MDGDRTTRITELTQVPLPLGDNSSPGQLFDASPEQVNDPQRTPPARSRSSLENPTPRRLSLPHTVSSQLPRVYSARSGTLRRHFNTTIRRPVSGRVAPGERQWTVFGQLMEHELHSSASRRIKKAPPPIPSDSESLRDYFPSPSGISEDRGSRVQSPVEDLLPSDTPDDDYDSDTPEAAQILALAEPKPPWYSIRHLPKLSNLQKNIFKCVIAYFIASLFTFSPYLSSFVSDITSDNEPGDSSPSPAGHMVATV